MTLLPMRKVIVLLMVAFVSGCCQVRDGSRASVPDQDSERRLQNEVDALHGELKLLQRKLDMLEGYARIGERPLEGHARALAARERAYPPKQRIRDLAAQKELLRRECEALEAQIRALNMFLSGPY